MKETADPRRVHFMEEDVNNRSIRLHRLQKIRMRGLCRYGCPICRIIRKGGDKMKRHGLRPKTSWKNRKVDAQYK